MRESKQLKLIVAVLLTYWVRELWTILPNNSNTFDPFPFYDMQADCDPGKDCKITLQTYVAFACNYAMWLIYFHVIHEQAKIVMPRFERIFHGFFLFQTLEFIEFFLTYNVATFKVLNVGINVTNIKICVMSLWVWVIYFKNNSDARGFL